MDYIITKSISRVLRDTGYAMIFNRKNGRVGHVFQDRYKSEVVESDQYLLQVIRYVHKNPVKAKITPSIDSYRWSR